jgi:DNA-directed RNA polymerase specialized sigma24 family protein
MIEHERDIILKEFTEIFQQKKSLFDSWCRYAQHLLNNLGGKHARHYKPEDVVQELILSLIEGRRTWDREKVPDINTFVRINLRSIVSNLRDKEKNLINFGNYIADEEACMEYIDRLHHIPNNRIEHELEMREGLKICFDALEAKGDIKCLKVMQCLLDQLKNNEISDRLDLPLREVQNIKKRIKKVLSKVISPYLIINKKTTLNKGK